MKKIHGSVASIQLLLRDYSFIPFTRELIRFADSVPAGLFFFVDNLHKINLLGDSSYTYS